MRFLEGRWRGCAGVRVGGFETGISVMVRIGRGRRGFEGLQVQGDLSLKDVVKKNRLMACMMQSTVLRFSRPAYR